MSHESRMDPSALLDRVKSGERVPASEFARVAEELRDPATRYRRYTLLHILGRGEQFQQRALVESFLESPRNPMLARLAVKILADWWPGSEAYRPTLLRFARGVDWDEDEEVRQMAVSILGTWLRRAPQTPDPEILGVLLEIATDPEEWETTRADAVDALARGLGRPYAELPSATRVEPLDSLWSREVLDEAWQRWGALQVGE